MVKLVLSDTFLDFFSTVTISCSPSSHTAFDTNIYLKIRIIYIFFRLKTFYFIVIKH